MAYKILLNELNQQSAQDSLCRKVYCSTCGGLVTTVKRKMTPDLQARIHSTLLNLTIDDFLLFGNWCQFLKEFDAYAVMAIYEREAQNIDFQNLRKLDKFLFQARSIYKYSSIYARLLEKGIQKAIEVADDSLIETLVLVLSSDIVNHDEFLSLAKSRANKKVHRALYNTLREIDSSVRNFNSDLQSK